MITTAGIAVPDDMAEALGRDAGALEAFQDLRPTDQREFVDWLARPGAEARQAKLQQLGRRVRQHRHRPAPAD
ncbi:YdeI/OmpD-associated family protein [Nakamurella endophytica]|uniref:Bacteriocin-protection, YdeI or OmpD-Associated n=1 Tax=Nakamurella endophytica TaxID=1748367 RepID=A0A917WLB3_9ACTN|nr:YdeI/OmpD-associated family protein [Nakamurella endophytica]GGM14208.1 hypothetical protein GCM10011594_37800 [Nakamurella endophytica]